MRILYETSDGTRSLETTLDGLAEALDQVQRDLASDGQAAVGIDVDGRWAPVNAQVLAERLRESDGQVAEIRVNSRPIEVVAYEAAQSAVEYATRLLAEGPALVDALYAGSPVEPSTLDDLFEGLAWVTDYLAVGLPLLEPGDRDDAVRDLQRRFGGAVLRLADSGDALDTTFLADILAHEILPAVAAVRERTLLVLQRVAP